MSSVQTISIKAQFRDDFRRFSINLPSTFSNLLQSIKTVYNLEETSLRIFHLDKTRGPSSINDDEEMKQMFSNNQGNTIRLLLIDNNSGSNSALDQMCDRILNSQRFQTGLANLMEKILTTPNFQSKLLAAGIKPLIQQEFASPPSASPSPMLKQQPSQQQQQHFSPKQEIQKQQQKVESPKTEPKKLESPKQQQQQQQQHHVQPEQIVVVQNSEPISIPQRDEAIQPIQQINEHKQEQQPAKLPSSPPKKGFLDSFVDSIRGNKKKQQAKQSNEKQQQNEVPQKSRNEKSERELDEEIAIIENLGFGLNRSEIAEILKFHSAYGEGIESAIESCLARQREQQQAEQNQNNLNQNNQPITV